MAEPIRIGFSDFWPGFDPFDNYFVRLLEETCDFDVVDEPDVLIYSCFGRRHIRHQGTRVFYTGEDVAPDLDICDYAFTFRLRTSDRESRLPLYALYFEPEDLIRPASTVSVGDPSDRGFCSFLVSNPRARERIRFFEQLSAYKTVDSGGRVLNNVGPVEDKASFISKYKFAITFENRSTPGYTTEKLPQALLAGTLPIYWGNPMVHLDFNPRSFVNAHDYATTESLIEAVKAIDKDDDLYRSYLAEPWLPGNRPTDFIDRETVISHFRRIFEEGVRRPRSRAHRLRERVLLFNEGYTLRRAVGMMLRRGGGHAGAPR